ncbi:class II fructose-bisphosphate aldolase [Moorella sp. ACPs]|uniref:class II fructose-bisphosphate aldolase n=1 Tax=Neomoorella carbonis TaxID=3062783 RepID=UPI00324E3526
MPLMSLKEVLADADRRHYGVGAFNVLNIEMLNAIIRAAEEEQAPVILAFAEGHQKYIAMETIAPLMLKAAREATVPVVVHYDHGRQFENIIKIMHYGFTSVMFDGSTLPYEENVRRTQEVVRIARILGVSVEAELGHVGGAEGVPGGEDDPQACYTDVNQAADFVARTGVDALAVAIGTAHGVYRTRPKLDLERLAAIKNRVGIPLVLHGGSGLRDDDFRQAIARGINKINIFTDISLAATRRIIAMLGDKDIPGSAGVVPYQGSDLLEGDFIQNASLTGYQDLMLAVTAAVKEEVKGKIRLFGSNGKVAGPAPPHARQPGRWPSL